MRDVLLWKVYVHFLEHLHVWCQQWSEKKLMGNEVQMLQKLLIHYLFDTMLCKNNLCENLTKTILGMKDSYGSHQDMRKYEICRELWLCSSENNWDNFHIPSTPYILKRVEKIRVMDIIRNLKTPSNYMGAIHKCLGMVNSDTWNHTTITCYCIKYNSDFLCFFHFTTLEEVLYRPYSFAQNFRIYECAKLKYVTKVL